METTKLIKRLIVPQPVVSTPAFEPGLHHYMREARGTFTRFYLRVEPDGRGMLLANATAAARLNQSGVIIAKGLLDDLEEKEIFSQLKTRFRGASSSIMQADLERVAALIANLDSPGDNYPIINLEDAAVSPYEAQLIAPLHADVSLSDPESMVAIIDRLWNAAIPHVTFLTGANPNRDHLIRAVERAEDTGLIAGVRGRASDFIQAGLVGDLAMAGVDHLNLFVASTNPVVHDAIFGEGDHQAISSIFQSILENEVAPVAEVPLIIATLDGIDETLGALLDFGVTNINFFAIAAPDEMPFDDRAGSLTSSAMPQTADMVEEIASELDVRFVWEPPVLRDPSLPFTKQVQMGPRCSDDLSIRVEPNGDVIPARGPYRSAGNLLTDEWNTIWNDDAFLRYRERVERPTRCVECPGLAICAADCPRKPAGWSQGYKETANETI